MRFLQCKCGNHTSWSTMGIPKCTVCVTCGSTLAEGPDGHAEPEAHVFVTQYNPLTGVPYEVCINCLRMKSELDKDKEAPQEKQAV